MSVNASVGHFPVREYRTPCQARLFALVPLGLACSPLLGRLAGSAHD